MQGELCFERLDAAADRGETVDADHGRIETRRQPRRRLRADRAASGEPRFPGLTTIARVEAVVEATGRTSLARRYDLSPAPP